MFFAVVKKAIFIGVFLALSACADMVPSCAPPTPAGGDIVYVTQQGWHVELGIPAQQLTGNMAFYRKVFSGARVVVFGYGKKTFFTAPADSLSEYILGPVPGPAVINVFALRVTPMVAYPDSDTVTLKLTPDQNVALLNYLWDDLTKDDAGKPIITAHGDSPAGLFYAAQSEYNLFHTCNTWAVAALHSAGLAIDDDGVIFAGQAMERIHAAAAGQCPVSVIGG